MSGWPAPLTSLRMASHPHILTFMTALIEITPILTVEGIERPCLGRESHACITEQAEFEAI